jgi:hypothetical protein
MDLGRADSSSEARMRKRFTILLLSGIVMGWLWGCSTRESGPRKIDRNPFKERKMSAPRP